jgi:hypothetical protein
LNTEICTKFIKTRTKKANERGRGPWAHLVGSPMPHGIGRWPTLPCHVTDLWESQVAHPGVPLHSWFLSWCIQRLRWSSLGSLSPLSFTWRAKTNFITDLPTKELTYLPRNHTIRDPSSTIGWWRGSGSKDRPMPLGVARCSLASNRPSPLPTSTPAPSTHYKGRCGARWRSSPTIPKHSKLSKALQAWNK